MNGPSLKFGTYSSVVGYKCRPETIIIDATFIKLHQHGTGAKGSTSSRRSGVAKAGNVNDIVPACDLLEGLLADKILAGRAYDANKLLALAERQKHEVVIPPIPGRLVQRKYDAHAYKERHLVECFFAKLKSFRRIATQYDKLAITFKAAVTLAACLTWLQ